MGPDEMVPFTLRKPSLLPVTSKDVTNYLKFQYGLISKEYLESTYQIRKSRGYCKGNPSLN
jgi:hypothetical protein